MNYQRILPEGWDNSESIYNMEQITNAWQNGKIIQAKVLKCDSSYNLHINLGNDIQAIIPREEIEAVNINNIGMTRPNICTNKVNQYVQFKVKNIINNKVILSRRSVGNEVIKWINNDLHQGDVIKGIVKNIRPYGVFVEVGGGIVGLLHIEDISVARIKTPEERFHVGQKINIMIKSIDRNLKRVTLTYKELLGTWEDNIKEYQEGETVTGIVRDAEKSKNGIFIELKPNLVGLAEYKENMEYGKIVDVYVKKIIPEKKKIKLNIVGIHECNMV